VEVNRRFAPDVYLGVMDLVDERGTVHDHAIVMRRLPVDRRLARLVTAGAAEAGAQVREVARRIAAAHDTAPRPAAASEAAQRDAVAANWEDNFTALDRFSGAPPNVLDADEVERVTRLARRYLAGRTALFDRRIAERRVVDGHGDLLADDIFCLDDGPRILDALAFDPRLRYGDVLADVAFLAMDLERLGDPGLAGRFLAWYREFAGERHPTTLAHHYIAYRAHVRAKVSCLRSEQGDDTAAGLARQLHALAAEHLDRGRVRLVLVGGAPGTGKSTVAARLAEETGWALLRSDEVRTELASLPPADDASAPVDQGLYRPERVAATYRHVLERAGRLLRSGEPVILDASWSSAEQRAAARRLADDTSTDLVELRCVAPQTVALERITLRRAAGHDPSDATPDVLAALGARFAAWPEAIELDTTRPLDQTVGYAVRAGGRT
jgi:aminoglycoside phosphotransferase family enzyme/predicted kinase